MRNGLYVLTAAALCLVVGFGMATHPGNYVVHAQVPDLPPLFKSGATVRQRSYSGRCTITEVKGAWVKCVDPAEPRKDEYWLNPATTQAWQEVPAGK